VILTNCQLATLPDKLSYSTTNITSPKGFTTRLPRRELFDVRLQLMAEDDGSSQTPLTGLDVTMPFFLSSPLHLTT
jgi:protein-histidine N-methyltransferase